MMLLLLGLIVVLGLIIALYAWSVYNSFVTLKEKVDNSWAQIDVQLKRRHDLIPNLIETVKGYAKHEKTLLTDITKYRSALLKGSPKERAGADSLLTSALGKLMVTVENYPKLKANENFLKLQEELAGTEDKISYVRTAYNDYIYMFNRKIQLFPSKIFANVFGFSKELDYFKTSESEKKVVEVKF